jgi:hypothetical protein
MEFGRAASRACALSHHGATRCALPARVGLSAPSPSLRASRLLGGSATIPLAQAH